MKQLKNIIVAIDFSITARNAYRYAKGFANSVGATLTVVHIKENYLTTTETLIAPVVEKDEQVLRNDIRELISEEEQQADKSIINSEVKIEIFNGNPVDVLIELSLKKDVDVIIIGTTGLADVLTKIIGSVSLKVANKAHCPVILVPRDAKWCPIEQIMYAANYDSITPIAIKEVEELNEKIGADIHFVNVKSFDPVFEIKQKEIDLKELLKSVNTNVHFETHTIYGNNTINELKKYCEEKNINVMAFVSKHRNFLENIIHHSITENMALSTITPMMVIHLDDK